MHMKGLIVHSWCIMTSHIHMILSVKEEYNLSDVIRDLKSFTSRHIRKFIEKNNKESRREWMLWMMKRAGTKKVNNKDFQFWLQHNHPIELSTNEMMDSRLDYVHNNPVEQGFVEKPEDWIYSSAADYCSVRKGMLELVFIE